MPDLRLPLTEGAVLEMPFAASGQYLARDTERKSFFVLVGKTTKTFMIQADLAGKSRRWNLGRHPDLSVREARDKAIEWLARIRRGEDPTAAGLGVDGPTLREAWARYEEAHLRRKGRSEKTIDGYRDCVERLLQPLLDKPLVELGREPRLVISAHDRITTGH